VGEEDDVAMRIDHVIYATADLDAAAARLEAEHGLLARGGGRHDGIGTHNRTVPLGRGYLELIAIADREEAAAAPLGRLLAARIDAVGEGLMNWCVSVDDVAAEGARLGAELSAIGRQGMTATLAGVAAAMADPSLPFFIERRAGSDDPAAGGAAAGGIQWVELAGDAARLRTWLGGEELPVRVHGGPPALLAVGIGERVLR
jgi:hypothetical protein